jgi:tetratricopeptide (TPR) repeat protein
MGLALAQGQNWLCRRGEDLPEVDREFIDLSVRRDALQRQQRERLRWRMFAMAIGALIVVSMLALFSRIQWREAVSQQQAARQERDRAERAGATFITQILLSASGVDDLNKAITLNPTDPSNYFTRAFFRNFKNDYDGAIEDLNHVIALDPRSLGSYILRSSIYAGKKEYDRALADLDKLVILDPIATWYSSRGFFYATKGDYDHAIADYDQAIALDPKYTIAYFNRGLAYYNKKDYDHAIADYDQAIALDPKYTIAYYNRGLAYYNKKDYDHDDCRLRSGHRARLKVFHRIQRSRPCLRKQRRL